MTPKQEAAMRQALDELEHGLQFGSVTRAITAMREALADRTVKESLMVASTSKQSLQVADEPVMIYHGRCIIDCGEHGHQDVEMLKMIPAGSKLYTRPQPAAQWVGLTDEEVETLSKWADKQGHGPWHLEFASAIEAKLKEKNT